MKWDKFFFYWREIIVLFCLFMLLDLLLYDEDVVGFLDFILEFLDFILFMIIIRFFIVIIYSGFVLGSIFSVDDVEVDIDLFFFFVMISFDVYGFGLLEIFNLVIFFFWGMGISIFGVGGFLISD